MVMVTVTLPPGRRKVTQLDRTYVVVDDPSTDSIISWSQSGNSFIIWNTTEFARDLLPTCFGHNHFSLFTLMLDLYGFRKVDSELWEYADDDFVKGKPERILNIINRPDSDSDSGPESRVSTRKTILKKKNAKSGAESRVSTRKTIMKKKKNKKNAKSDEESRVSTRMTIPKEEEKDEQVSCKGNSGSIARFTNLKNILI